MRRCAAALALSLALIGTGTSGAPALTIGIGDQKPDMFSDPQFLALGVQHARLAVPYDVLQSPRAAQQLDAWLQRARAAGVTPLVSFAHSRVRPNVLPTSAQLVDTVRRIRLRYPWVTDFATWNEANHCGERTCHKPELVGRWYRALRRVCSGSCRLLAAEVLDTSDMADWVRAFRRAAGVEPRYWGLHNYVDVNRHRTTGTRTLLRVARGQVWLTETGGIVRRRNRSRVTFPESTAHAALATRWLFSSLVGISPRITRVYLYHWNAAPKFTTWDSALVGADGRPRPALAVLQRQLLALGAHR